MNVLFKCPLVQSWSVVLPTTGFILPLSQASPRSWDCLGLLLVCGARSFVVGVLECKVDRCGSGHVSPVIDSGCCV